MLVAVGLISASFGAIVGFICCAILNRGTMADEREAMLKCCDYFMEMKCKDCAHRNEALSIEKFEKI